MGGQEFRGKECCFLRLRLRAKGWGGVGTGGVLKKLAIAKLFFYVQSNLFFKKVRTMF